MAAFGERWICVTFLAIGFACWFASLNSGCSWLFTFTRWMKKAGVNDAALTAAVLEMSQGLVDADLGGHIIKKRVALPGQGKSGGARTIVATKMDDRWFFLYGFNKNERSNID